MGELTSNALTLDILFVKFRRTWRVNLKLTRYVLNKCRTLELSIVRRWHGQQMDRHYLLVTLTVSYECLM